MKTHIATLIVTGALTLTVACAPGEEPDFTAPDPLAFAAVDLNADSLIEQDEFASWLTARMAVDETTVEANDDGMSDDLDLKLTESEWRDSGRYVFTRTDEPAEFEEWDTDGDQLLDPFEALAGLDAEGEGEPIQTGPVTSQQELSTVLFRLWDLDGNGSLEPDEYRGGIAVWWP